MYAYIKGNIVSKNNERIIIENAGIGYEIFMPTNSVEKLNENEEQKIYTYYNVTQDNISLFGFLDLKEKSMFEKLISVSKIEAKTAIGILSNIQTNELVYAIISEDVTKLSKLPGIGKKTAQRLIIEIKDKLDTKDAIILEVKEDKKLDSKMEDVTEALLMLGFANKQIITVLEKLDSTKSTEELIKDALKEMR